MFKKILVALDNSRANRAMFPRIAELAGIQGSELLLVQVADSWAIPPLAFSRFRMRRSAI